MSWKERNETGQGNETEERVRGLENSVWGQGRRSGGGREGCGK